MNRYTLVCPTCCKGWEADTDRGTCGGCGKPAVPRGSYHVIELEGRP